MVIADRNLNGAPHAVTGDARGVRVRDGRRAPAPTGPGIGHLVE